MSWRSHLSTGGFVGAACAACCVPPLIASLGLVGGLAATAGLVGGIALAVAVLIGGIATVTARRRSRRGGCDESPTTVMVDAPVGRVDHT